MTQRIEDHHPRAVELSGEAFAFMGQQARTALVLTVRLQEQGAEALADRLAGIGDDLPALRDELDAAAHGLHWAASVCDMGREIVDAALAANDAN